MQEKIRKAYEMEIDEHHHDQRIDNFLNGYLKSVPKSYVYRVLRKGEVRVNKGRIKPNYRLQVGDIVRIPPMVLDEEDKQRPNIPPSLLKTLADNILFEDDSLIVLNKPSGLAVHGGSELKYGAIEALRMLFPQQPFLELVHRLDRETSGCLLFAKTRPQLVYLHEMIRAGQVDKTYLALVRGRWEGGVREVNAPLQRDIVRSGERMVQVDAEGKSALTQFKAVGHYKDATLLEVRLLTGRTHQIRVHAAHIGYPLAGDVKYGDQTFNKKLKQYGLNRLFLHARSLGFIHPQTGKSCEYTAVLPKELDQVLTAIKQQES